MDHRTLNDLAGEVRAALHAAQLPATVEAGTSLDDGLGTLELALDGRTIELVVATRADLRPVHATDILAAGDGRPGLVVADRVAERSRQTLRDHGWGWLDRRRGSLRVWAPGVRVEMAIPPMVGHERTAPANAFTPAGRQLALWLLVHPDEPASPRGIARDLGISAGQISNLLRALEGENLLRRDRRPLVPELFWALVEQWQPRRHALVSLPAAGELAGASELRSERWVVTDTVAAVRWGAPVVGRPDAPPDLYLPDERSLSWLLGRSVLAAEWGQRTATVAVAPTPLACDPRLRLGRTVDGRPLAHPVVVALDLATDRGRGRESVEQWQPAPDLGVDRVW